MRPTSRPCRRKHDGRPSLEPGDSSMTDATLRHMTFGHPSDGTQRGHFKRGHERPHRSREIAPAGLRMPQAMAPSRAGAARRQDACSA